MEDDLLNSCFFNETHLICKEPVKLSCDSGVRYSCQECLLNRVNYSGWYQCKLCQSEHRFNFLTVKSTVTRTTSHQKNYEKTIINKKAVDLIELADRNAENLKGNLFLRILKILSDDSA